MALLAEMKERVSEGLGRDPELRKKQCDLETIKFMFAKVAGFLVRSHPIANSIPGSALLSLAGLAWGVSNCFWP